MTINIDATPAAPIAVKLVGIEYEFHKPKGALALKIAEVAQRAKSSAANVEDLMDTLTGWLTAASDKETADAIMARMSDSDDLLDIDHVMQLVKALTEAGSKHPTS